MKNTTLENLIQNIDATDVVPVPKPVEHLASESHQFYKILETEKERFQARGLSAGFLSLGYVLSEELVKREGEWLANRFGDPEKVKLWKKHAPDAGKLCSNLLQDLDLALMDNKEAQHSLKSIKKGEGEEDMLLDISKLVQLGRNYPEEIVANGLSEEYLADAELKGQQYASLFAAAEIAVDKNRAIKEARDKAKVFTSNYLSLIRKYADAIYRDEPEKRELFVSEYDADRNRLQKKREQDAKESESVIEEDMLNLGLCTEP